MVPALECGRDDGPPRQLLLVAAVGDGRGLEPDLDLQIARSSTERERPMRACCEIRGPPKNAWREHSVSGYGSGKQREYVRRITHAPSPSPHHPPSPSASASPMLCASERAGMAAWLRSPAVRGAATTSSLSAARPALETVAGRACAQQSEHGMPYAMGHVWRYSLYVRRRVRLLLHYVHGRPLAPDLDMSIPSSPNSPSNMASPTSAHDSSATPALSMTPAPRARLASDGPRLNRTPALATPRNSCLRRPLRPAGAADEARSRRIMVARLQQPSRCMHKRPWSCIHHCYQASHIV
ncbi:hypothetical protein P171DRAFT_441846 [Karstenula rhodostoma CBS 690.94]|uniref:Uncharacterized protein n=1 Tax=Karstenula rhodostoma CBS 690.94 TaxID=1392251 RepID=A0A9P4PMQ1_9PLEO|nr:hypothetical protein P171DRAFT_441846 [Karstenula rhodostoma CBS 690.94]